MKTLIAATRGSALALWQARYVKKLLEDCTPGLTVEFDTIKTTGDKVQDRFLHEIGGKGLFIKELEEALLLRKADFAVHSLKDLPARLEAPFCIAGILRRHAAGDLLIANEKSAALFGLQHGQVSTITPEHVRAWPRLTIATSSLRRSHLLMHCNPRLSVVPLRGNVDTRMQKLARGEFDAIILAEASIERLRLDAPFAGRLAPQWFVPSPGQGALCLESTVEHEFRELAKTLDDRATHSAITVERAILRALGGDCTMPFGCHVVWSDPSLTQCTINIVVVSQTREARVTAMSAGGSLRSICASAYATLEAAGLAEVLAELKIIAPGPREFDAIFAD